MNEKLLIKTKDGSAYAYSLSDIVGTPNGGNLEERYLFAEQIDTIRQTRWPTTNTGWFGTSFGKGVNLLHFSDIHGDYINLTRIVKFKQSISFGLDALFTGDMVNHEWSDGIDFWSNSGANNIMVAIGNHDSLSGQNWYAKTAAECYSRYISPFVENWGVTYQTDVCYYYKDWADKKVRLIVLDVMHWDAAQKLWFENLLSDSLSSEYHIAVAGHCSPATSDGGIKTCSFDTWGANRSHWESQTFGKMNSEAPTAVKNFIDAGGHFVCWLTGHTHADMFRYLVSYPNQLYVAVGDAGINANVSSNASSQLDRVLGEKSQDLFNLVSINATRQTLTITRVGADHDTIGRHIGTVVYDYANHEIIWND